MIHFFRVYFVGIAVSTAFHAGMCYFSKPAQWVPAGNLPICVLMAFFATVITIVPIYAFAAWLRRKFRWRLWAELPIAAVCYLLLSAVWFLMYAMEPEPGVIAEMFRTAATLFAGSLPYIGSVAVARYFNHRSA